VPLLTFCCLCILVSEKLVLGSNDRGVHMYNSDEALKEKMKIACTRLNLTEHSVKGSDDLIAKTISVSHGHQLLATLSPRTTCSSLTTTHHFASSTLLTHHSHTSTYTLPLTHFHSHTSTHTGGDRCSRIPGRRRPTLFNVVSSCISTGTSSMHASFKTGTS